MFLLLLQPHKSRRHFSIASSVIKTFSDPVEYLNKCVAACKKTACGSESDLKNGCNQMYSCVHACKIRHLGVNENQCRNHCNRNARSGCSPKINGYQFALCGSCSRGGCSRWPTIAECEIGCATYGKRYLFNI